MLKKRYHYIFSYREALAILLEAVASSTATASQVILRFGGVVFRYSGS